VITLLPRSFYDRPAVEVARDLLGSRLVRRLDGTRLAGIITETEAYQGEDDLGCHARAGRTPRTANMYGPPGHAYIYFTYGMHWLLNAVTCAEGCPAAVLLRAIQPLEGLERMALNRPNLAHTSHWTDGPARLTQALALDGQLNGIDLCDPAGELVIEPGDCILDEQVVVGSRVGLFTVPEPWKSIPWRFIATISPSPPH
jgi:DNA-3-methyladenine glycosylase